VQPKSGGGFHPKLNIVTRPIAYKYCEGKVKSTLKRGLKAFEIVKRETHINGNSSVGAFSLDRESVWGNSVETSGDLGKAPVKDESVLL